jgi:hypothetical protein
MRKNGKAVRITRRFMAILPIALPAIAVPGPALAYIGPGAGLGLVGVIAGLALTILMAIGIVVLWPLRRLWRHARPNRPTNDPQGAMAQTVGVGPEKDLPDG